MSLLGKKVKDMITGFEGIANCEAVWEHSQPRIGVQPQTLKDGAVMDAVWFDVDQLIVLQEPTEEIQAILKKHKKPRFAIGSMGKCSTTGFEGRIIAIATWLFGCTRYTLQPTKLDKDGKIPPSESIEETNLTLISPPTTSRPTKPPGGPQPNPSRAKDPVR